MAEYIDRAVCLSILRAKANMAVLMDAAPYFEKAAQMLEKLPAADVVPVVHGRFVHDGPRFAGGVDWWHCSSCGRLVSGVETRFDYCPHCGAKVDGGDIDAAN